MHLTNHARLHDILFAYKPRQSEVSGTMRILKQRPPADNPIRLYVPLKASDIVTHGDVVEDIQTGKREVVKAGSFYSLLVGLRAAQAKQLPAIYDILRPL